MRGIFQAKNRPWIPPELADAEGLVGVGGDLRPPTLIAAYADGVFPWFNEDDPILWWSPDPRAIIELDQLHISRSLTRTLKKQKFRVTVNQCFEQVMRACGDRDEGTWVTEGMIRAYVDLHKMGAAHSIETWVGDELAGGIYGVSVGGLFAAESMFYRITDGSKVAMVALVARLKERGFELLDVQMTTEHTLRMGAQEIPRRIYLQRLRQAVAKSSVQFI